jgi:hypothetical protein
MDIELDLNWASATRSTEESVGGRAGTVGRPRVLMARAPQIAHHQALREIGVLAISHKGPGGGRCVRRRRRAQQKLAPDARGRYVRRPRTASAPTRFRPSDEEVSR